MLSADELGEFITSRHETDLFRLETRDVLNVPQDADRLQRYLNGEPGPGHRPWADVIRKQVAQGQITRRVLALTEPLTDYRRSSIEWGYLDNVAAGERCRVVSKSDTPEVGAQDFWVVERRHVLLMHYDNEGRFVGAEPVNDEQAVGHWTAIADLAWDAGTDLVTWWDEHPQYWRDSRDPTPRSE
ncbi:hypothetical protein GCM10027059_03530 [Myceligenerans halotolerans]